MNYFTAFPDLAPDVSFGDDVMVAWGFLRGTVFGGMVLAIAVEPVLRLEEQTTPAEEVSEAVDRRGRLAPACREATAPRAQAQGIA